MRNIDEIKLRRPFSYPNVFMLGNLRIIATDHGGWDHVSVSLENRCPNWQEMCTVKDVFFLPEEMVVQYHPAEEEYVNVHPYCLHLWRPQHGEIPKPPKHLVL